MQIFGPLPLGPLGQTNQTLELKPFQRVTAEIMQVSGTQVILSIDGIPVVAEVSSSELAAALRERSSAQFIVSQTEDGKTALRLVTPGQGQSGLSLSQSGSSLSLAGSVNGQPGSLPAQAESARAALAAENSQNLTLQLLKAYGLPVTQATQTAAEAAINQRLAIQPGQMEQLLRTMASLPGWGAQEANLAAAILASGLPLTPQSLELAARPDGLTAENFSTLLGQLGTAAQDPGLPPEFREQAARVLQMFQEVVLAPGSAADLPEQLAQAVDLLGRPLENRLAEEARGALSATPGGAAPGQAAARPSGLLQAALGAANLPAEVKDLLQALTQTLQDANAARSFPAGLAAELGQAVRLLGPALEGLLAGQAAAGGGAGQGQESGYISSQETSRQLAGLQTALQQSGLPVETRDLLGAVFQALEQASANPASAPGLTGRLAQVVEQLVKPPEGVPAEAAPAPGTGAGSPASAPARDAAGAGLQDTLRQLGQLQTALRDSGLQPEVKALLRTVYQTLQEASLAGASGANLAEQLAQALDWMGQPLESLLAERALLPRAGSAPGSGLAGMRPGPEGSGGPNHLLVLGQMQAALQQSSLPPEIKEVLQTVYQALLQNLADPGGSADLSGKLTRALNLFGQAQETRLAEEAHTAGGSASASGLASMANLQQEAARSGKHELARVLEDFMQSLSKAQWQNIPAGSQSQREDWVEAALWMRLPVPNQGQENIPVRLRIDRPPEDSPRKIDAGQAHMIVQVELPGQQVFQVEIGLSQRQVKAEITVPDPALIEPARAELSGLAESLQDQGYALKEPQIELGKAHHFEKITVLPPQGGRAGVNREA